MAALPGALGTPPDDDQVAVVDAFLAGLRTPVVASVLCPDSGATHFEVRCTCLLRKDTRW